MTTDKSHMFWGTGANGAYGDGIPVPRVTYRCKGSAVVVGSSKYTSRKHGCKLVTDHPNPCQCVCGQKFNEKEEAAQ